MGSQPGDLKTEVKAFWENAACGEALYLDSRSRDGFHEALKRRYELEPYIRKYADFEAFRGRKVLEVGVGMGADHEMFARAGADLSGVDLTERAVELTTARLAHLGLGSDLRVGDAEALPFEDNTFDHVYSWGVIHHSPNTPKAAQEILRVLKPGGTFAVMVYHRASMIGLMLWLRYALLAGRPFRSLDSVYFDHLESAGTKAYSTKEARELFSGAGEVTIAIELAPADLLAGPAGQRHGGAVLSAARALWPSRFVKKYLSGYGLYLLILGRK